MARQHRVRDEAEHQANVNQARHQPVPASREDDAAGGERSAMTTSNGSWRSGGVVCAGRPGACAGGPVEGGSVWLSQC